MSWNYAREMISKALKKAKGNAARAQRAVIEESLQDNRLLIELAQPHLKGIVAHAVDRVIREQSMPEEQTPEAPESLDMPLDEFGRSLLGALQGRNTPRFGKEDSAPPTGHKAASKAHIDAINKIATTRKSKKP